MYVHLYLCDIRYREVVSSALAKEVSRIYVDNYTLHFISESTCVHYCRLPQLLHLWLPLL